MVLSFEEEQQQKAVNIGSAHVDQLTFLKRFIRDDIDMSVLTNSSYTFF